MGLLRSGISRLLGDKARKLCSSTPMKNNLCLHAVNISFILRLSQ